jgi:hypothetical protein
MTYVDQASPRGIQNQGCRLLDFDRQARFKPCILCAAVRNLVATRVTEHASPIDLVVKRVMHVPMHPQSGTPHQMDQVKGIGARGQT